MVHALLLLSPYYTDSFSDFERSRFGPSGRKTLMSRCSLSVEGSISGHDACQDH